MPVRRAVPATASFWGAAALVVVAALGAGALVAAAYQHANPPAPDSAPAPVPTFTLGVGVGTPTPTPTPEPAVALPRDSERFLAVSADAGVWWRGVAGACGGTAPLVERSADAGATWTDVTPLYLGAAQLAALEASDQTEAILIAGVGADCEPQALRTFTQGRFWESYPDVLAASRYSPPTDADVVSTPIGPLAAPCAEARGPRAAGEVVALVCDGAAYASLAGAEWVALPAPDAAAVATDGADVVVAHRSDACPHLTVTRFAGASPDAPGEATCADGDPAQPTALALTAAGPVVWSAETLTAPVSE